jgi:hypothetical protein
MTTDPLIVAIRSLSDQALENAIAVERQRPGTLELPKGVTYAPHNLLTLLLAMQRERSTAKEQTK